MQILSYVLTVVSIILIIMMLFTFRKVRSVSVKAPLIAIAVSLVGFIVYKAIIGTSLTTALLWLLATIGFVLGLWQGKKTKVWMENGQRKAQNTMWFIVIWALSFGFNQLLAVTGQALSMNMGIGALSFSTGIAIGAQMVILAKMLRARPLKTAPTPGPAAPAIAALRAAPAGALSAAGPAAFVKCPNCGVASQPRQTYCSNCGQRLASGAAQPQAAVLPLGESPRKASGAWWILAFWPVIGAFIVWGALSKTDRSLATRIVLVNLALTMIALITIVQNNI